MYQWDLQVFPHSEQWDLGYYMGLVMGVLHHKLMDVTVVVICEVPMWEFSVIAESSDLLYSLFSDSAKEELSLFLLSFF